MLRYLIIVIIYFSSVYSSCRKGIGCKEITYSFSTGIRAYPDSDSINVNDTIWVEFSNSTQLHDINLGVNIDFSGANNLGTSIDYLKFTGGSISNPGVVPAANDFDYNLVTGIFIPDPFQPICSTWK